MTPTGSTVATAAGPEIFISAAEPSGDRHAAELIRAIREVLPQSRFWGVAGPAMQAAGCEAIEDFTARATMLAGAVKLAGHAWRLMGRVRRLVEQRGPALAIVVDSPALHLPMARHLKRAGCPVMYYIAPQLWAWAPWRIGKLRRRVDRLAVILPFEERYFTQRGMPARYVGHPLVTQLAGETPDAAAVAAIRASGRPVIACLPGSRSHVVREVLPGQIEVARAIHREFPQAAFAFAAAGAAAEQVIRATLAPEGFPWTLHTGRNADVLGAADLALCASGTATLEVAFHRVPMVVMYNGSKWGYRLVGRWLITTPHLSLANILAGRRIVPEFMPYYASTAPIAAEALDILRSPQRQAAIKGELDGVIRSLGTSNAAKQAAAMAAEMIQSPA